MGRKPKEENLCVDCKEYALKYKKDYFVLNEELWEEFGCKRGLLCWDCFQKRMGRPFELQDFIECGANRDNPNIQLIRGNNGIY